MGQTLTHGVYLPDEGERNCYSGLASNWSILDNSVGTIAEHTTALAGKAPAVHTHTVSDITDFPAYGNTAGTICEGNDSRLSDARTPVAHTHTKSDVTDLLNSNFIPSANNSYDLGSSSYQWNNVYSKGYYYNGTPWGLNKENTWTGQNTFKTTVTYDGNFACYWKRANLTVGTLPSSIMYYGATRYTDSAGTSIALTRGLVDTSGKNCFRTYTYAFNNTSKYCVIGSGINADGSGSYFAFNAENVIPNDNNTTNLGTSDNKWKTLNGINPGALSLPQVATNFEDLTGYVLDGVTENRFPISGSTALDGWLQCRVKHTLGTASFLRMEMSYRVWTAQDKDCVEEYTLWIPVKAGVSFDKVICLADDLKIRFHPCLGNV